MFVAIWKEIPFVRKKICVLMNIGARPIKKMLLQPLAEANGKGYCPEYAVWLIKALSFAVTFM